MLAVPLVGLTSVMESVSPFGSLSFARAGTETPTFFAVEAESFTAKGGKVLTVVVTVVWTGGVTLLVEFGSLVGPPTLAALVMPPRNGAVTVSVRFVLPPAARLPRLAQIDRKSTRLNS